MIICRIASTHEGNGEGEVAAHLRHVPRDDVVEVVEVELKEEHPRGVLAQAVQGALQDEALAVDIV